jgi:hypothetical protein
MGCDAVAVYNVENRTSQELLTWPSFDDCFEISASSDQGLEEAAVSPGTTYSYFTTYAPWVEDVKCVVVATPNRRLVTAAPYEYDGFVAVDEPVEPGITMPEQRHPESAGWKLALEGNLQWIVIMAIFGTTGMAVVAAISYAIFRRIKDRRQHAKGS